MATDQDRALGDHVRAAKQVATRRAREAGAVISGTLEVHATTISLNLDRLVSPAQQFVRYALTIGALELVPEGRKLKSGRMSPYFFNSGLFDSGQSLRELAEAYASAIIGAYEKDGLLPQVLFGPAYKGIALAAATAVVLADGILEEYLNIGYASNRKEAKDHGEGGLLIGSSLEGKKVMIVDDVITDGASKREAFDFIKEHGGTPVACAIAFDRQERGKEENDPRSASRRFEDDYGIPVRSAACLNDLIEVLQAEPSFPKATETLPKILEYRSQYGSR